jgi:hypothetical protein
MLLRRIPNYARFLLQEIQRVMKRVFPPVQIHLKTFNLCGICGGNLSREHSGTQNQLNANRGSCFYQDLFRMD